jgi:hypothetical protein
MLLKEAFQKDGGNWRRIGEKPRDKRIGNESAMLNELEFLDTCASFSTIRRSFKSHWHEGDRQWLSFRSPIVSASFI